MAETEGSTAYPGGYADYVKRRLSPALVAGLTKIAEYRPKDPIEFLGHYLHRYRAQCALEPGNGRSITDFQKSQTLEDTKPLDEDHIVEDINDISSYDFTGTACVHKECNGTFTCIGDIFDDIDFV